MHEGLDRERGQCSAGKSGLLSPSVQAGVGGGLLCQTLEKQQLVQRKRREMKTEGGGEDREEEREVEYIEVFVFQAFLS